MIRKIGRILLPPGSQQRILAGKLKKVLRRTDKRQYPIWVRDIEPTTLSPNLTKQDINISIVVPCFNTPSRYFKALVDSVIAQSYKSWQLCIVDGSTDNDNSDYIKSYCSKDARIKYIKTNGNLGIAGNTTEGIKHASGGYIGFLDHDDILPTWCLNEVAVAIKANPSGQIFYSDEDRLTDNGKTRMSPLFKPDWSPDFFLAANYVTHFLIFEAKLLKKLSPLRSEYDGSQDYDLVLRALDESPNIVHIPKILYHMRMADTSTAKKISIKDYAHNTGNQAIADYLSRNKINAEVQAVPDRPTNHRIHYSLKDEPLVSIIIPFKDKVALLKTAVGSILKKSTYKNFEIILLSNNSKEKRTFDYLKQLKPNSKIRQFTYNKTFNYSAINNYGRKQARGRVLVFLNNDTKVLSGDWLQELASVALRPEVGAVGPMLLYPDKTIQHAGIILKMTGMAGHVFRGLKPGTLTPLWLPDWPRNYLAVTGACLAVEARKFDELHGFNEDFIICGSDVTLCLDLHKKNYKNVYWPYVRLIHFESKSVGSYQNAPASDYDLSQIHYQPYLTQGDPYFNKNLDIMYEVPTLGGRNGKH